MSWFNKNKKEEKIQEMKLPELPKLPSLPNFEENKNISKESLSQLPSFPTSSLGEKFSQNAIKDAVTGKKEEKGLPANDFEEENNQMMQKPFKTALTKEIEEEKEIPKIKEIESSPKIIEEPTPALVSKPARKEPIFIRVDKFEEGLKTFENAKEKINDLQEMLKEIKGIKENEEKELQEWETEIQSIKSQIEKVDRDIFSKIE